MEREYFCGGCGLFHWNKSSDSVSKTYMIQQLLHKGCPNEECISHKEKSYVMLAVDTMAFAYYSEKHEKFIKEKSWSSPIYAPPYAIEIYKKQNIIIK